MRVVHLEQQVRLARVVGARKEGVLRLLDIQHVPRLLLDDQLEEAGGVRRRVPAFHRHVRPIDRKASGAIDHFAREEHAAGAGLDRQVAGVESPFAVGDLHENRVRRRRGRQRPRHGIGVGRSESGGVRGPRVVQRVAVGIIRGDADLQHVARIRGSHWVAAFAGGEGENRRRLIREDQIELGHAVQVSERDADVLRAGAEGARPLQLIVAGGRNARYDEDTVAVGGDRSRDLVAEGVEESHFRRDQRSECVDFLEGDRSVFQERASGDRSRRFRRQQEKPVQGHRVLADAEDLFVASRRESGLPVADHVSPDVLPRDDEVAMRIRLGLARRDDRSRRQPLEVNVGVGQRHLRGDLVLLPGAELRQHVAMHLAAQNRARSNPDLRPRSCDGLHPCRRRDERQCDRDGDPKGPTVSGRFRACEVRHHGSLLQFQNGTRIGPVLRGDVCWPRSG